MLTKIAKQLVTQGKGILAADESTGSIKKKFEEVGVEDTAENHRKWRQLLFTAPEIERYISGVIMFDETFWQETDEGVPFPEYLSRRGIMPGIKVDEGRVPFPGSPKEKLTKGIETLPERIKRYANKGAKFAKWRGLFIIDEKENLPSDAAIAENSKLLARYAKICQNAGVVPIVEPEVYMNGPHSLFASREATSRALRATFMELEKIEIDYTGMLLKPNMVHQGTMSRETHSPEEIAKATLEVLEENVPREVPGIVFLSGGQAPREAEDNLRAINREGGAPWELAFSYGRALQDEAFAIWAGDMGKFVEVQKAFLEAAHRDSHAREGERHEEN